MFKFIFDLFFVILTIFIIGLSFLGDPMGTIKMLAVVFSIAAVGLVLAIVVTIISPTLRDFVTKKQF